MNAWSVFVIEKSVGVYQATATRDTGNKVDRSGGEEVLATVLQDAYQMEISLGSLHGDAAYVVTKAAKPGWKSEYYEHIFGSWYIHSPDDLTRIDYDGKDFFLMIQKGSKMAPTIVWQGRLSASEPLTIAYFQTIQELT